MKAVSTVNKSITAIYLLNDIGDTLWNILKDMKVANAPLSYI